MASEPRDGFEAHRAAFRDIALPRRRLDYVVRASADKPALAPVYYVKLHLARPDADSAPEPVHPKVRVSSFSKGPLASRPNPPRATQVTLTLTVEQMHDFLRMVRDANHQARRLAA